MVRVQIQLPDEVHSRAQRLAAAKEISLAELVRRGLELVFAQTAAPEEILKPWRAPIVSGLGWKGLSHAEIRDQAQETAVKEATRVG
jgi:hypothetical protein